MMRTEEGSSLTRVVWRTDAHAERETPPESAAGKTDAQPTFLDERNEYLSDRVRTTKDFIIHV